ncbi:hypothetical protein [Streptomyces sp. OE57]|uniref:hypothetical protein n=1 Tax=Streptomyces lacaronensis TaxID=3379885 RepID=UPI0039B77D10
MPELAAAVSEISDEPVVYRDLCADDYSKVLLDAGLPEPKARMIAQTDLDIAADLLEEHSGDLSRLIGRPTTPLRDSLTTLLRG